jgi:uncharacterized protein YecE (DUF72 family)
VIRVGTAGFSYKDWEGPVYPKPKPASFDGLKFLAQSFDCIEMNVSFYRVPTASQVATWVERVADREQFRFLFKLYRGVTHDGDDAPIAEFLEALQPARERLGAILLQFPFWFRNTQPNRARLSALASRLDGWPCALEVRDRSWLIDPALQYLRQLNLNIVNIDLPQSADSVPPGAWTTGPVGYVRLHGRNAQAWFDKGAHRDQKYDYLYSGEELEEWCGRIRSIASATDSVYVVTNNHFGGQAVANAFELARKLDRCTPSRPPESPQPLSESLPERLTQSFPHLL